ncbi:hypothetical protein S40285_10142 [Stachybotrys chlorohalonatus IBT 40285]|jgi:hypothetical protein|uniref:Uncharacterized protein n=1 Tax=Stachybotrys chlorohalonatus (strain IBT 40285) TaxID=1283841 RepID=A0A084QFV5_STAC4|nr:hypothetical protein S40285_10142 [Stachybotrys chlorohalonata IBT 40285]
MKSSQSVKHLLEEVVVLVGPCVMLGTVVEVVVVKELLVDLVDDVSGIPVVDLVEVVSEVRDVERVEAVPEVMVEDVSESLVVVLMEEVSEALVVDVVEGIRDVVTVDLTELVVLVVVTLVEVGTHGGGEGEFCGEQVL